MKIVGLITEYNPLHNGHLYHFNEVKKKTNADLFVLVMSSSFTMRGDLSIFNKFIKTRQALDLGIDLIIELPFVYSVERADIFSLNAVKILNLLNVNEIWIGSENNDISLYEKYYNESINIDNSTSFNTSYKNKSNLDLLSNDLLGYFYYKAIKDNNYNIKLNTIKRIDNNYLDNNLVNSDIQSANAIRNNLNELDKYTPNFVSKDINNILDENKLFIFLKYKILSETPNNLKNIFFVDEGIEYKLKDIINYNNLNNYIDYLSNKRYSKTRIKRMLMYILFNITKDVINKIYQDDINYIRVLGYTNIGKEYLNKMKKNINIYTNIKEGINDILDIEIKISKNLDNIYNTNIFNLEQKGPITK